MNVKDIKKPLIIFLTIFTFMSIVLYGTIYYTFSDRENELKLLNGSKQITNQTQLKLNFILNRDTELSNTIIKTIQFSTKNGISLIKQEELINNIFKETLTKHKCIFQMRLLDSKGVEKIRVERFPNLKEDKVYISNEFQDKSDRNYFKHAKKTKDVFFSQIDYNIEHGKIEIPLIATTRMVYPIWTADEFQGAIIINFDIKKIIESVAIDSNYDMVLLKNYPDEFNILYSTLNLNTESMIKLEENIRKNYYNGIFSEFTDTTTFTDLTVYTKLSEPENDRLSNTTFNRVFFTIFSIILSSILFSIAMSIIIKKFMFQVDNI